MAKAARRFVGDKISSWLLEEKLGGGGNGVVWRVSRTGEPDRALKVLRNIGKLALDRLAAEIEALGLVVAIDGVVPLLEQDFPRDRASGPRWFVMPLAQPPSTLLAGKNAIEIVKLFIPLAETLAALHELGIHHRDIKLSNLLVLNNRLCFSDFGLVKYPSRKEITPDRQDVGPKFTMAPEMRREAALADGGPADVYSFAKTMWVALTQESRGFDGQYSAEGVLAISRHHPEVLTTPLDELLAECTDNAPSGRPQIKTVIQRLKDWVDTQEDFHRRNLVEWVEVQNTLFPIGAPERAYWHDIDAICSVLRLVSRNESLNHMFFPSGGGLSIHGVSVAREKGFIRLGTGIPTLLKPRKLSFESFGAGSQFNYFRLEAENIAPTGTLGAHVSQDGYYEDLCAIRPGEYVTPDAWEVNEFRGQPLPKGAEPVSRYLKGSFVIFSTRSPYNQDPSTYDARHEAKGEDGFREYIARNAARARVQQKP